VTGTFVENTVKLEETSNKLLLKLISGKFRQMKRKMWRSYRISDTTFETLFGQVQKLSTTQRLRISLQTDFVRETDWHTALRATYGILADDPIERPPQLPLEEREPIERNIC